MGPRDSRYISFCPDFRRIEMPIEEELQRQSPQKECILSIGVFDGVHLGHQYLLSKLRDKGKDLGLEALAITFLQHPHFVLYNNPIPYLCPLEERLNLIKGLGVKPIPLSFTPELSQMRAKDFLLLLQRYLNMKGMVIGYDFALGRDREGNIETLVKLGEEMGFFIEIVPPVKIGDEVISSSAIRKALSQGEVGKVREFLGRPFSIKGRVVRGVERGRALGFPTANLSLDPQQALAADGVYATLAYLGSNPFPSATNIGTRPTFGQGNRTIEVHLIGFEGDLYGKEIRLEFIQRLREERHFASLEELKSQIKRDIKSAKEILSA